MITSITNEKLKNVKALLDRSGVRRKTGLFVAEGIRMFREIPPDRICETYIAYSFAKEHPEIHGETVTDEIFRKISDTQHPQGVLAVIRQNRFCTEDFIGGRMFLILEGIQDPGNLGTIIRTAEAAGAAGIIMDRNTADAYSPKVVRSTMGSIFRVPFVYTDDLAAQTEKLRDRGVSIYAAHLDGKPLGEEKLASPRAFLIGNEGSGLSDTMAELADAKIRIPMAGKVESLNAAVSAAILMYTA